MTGCCALPSGPMPTAMLSPMLPPMVSDAKIGAAKTIWSTKPRERPITSSPTTSTMPAKVWIWGIAPTGTHSATKIAIAPAIATRTVDGTPEAANMGAAMNAPPARAIRNTIRQNSPSSGTPKEKTFTGRYSRPARKPLA